MVRAEYKKKRKKRMNERKERNEKTTKQNIIMSVGKRKQGKWNLHAWLHFRLPITWTLAVERKYSIYTFFIFTIHKITLNMHA